jgi:FkbM family methyltransferase
MLPILRYIKNGVEQISGCRIYRNTLPHGVDCYHDIEKRFGRKCIKLVFDVGANIGQSAVNYLRQFPEAEIYSFEPVAATYQKLVVATRRFTRVHPYNLGMGREPGKIGINVNPLSRTCSIVWQRPEDHPETVEMETIAGFSEKHHLGTIDFLKVDTEGYDLEVLAGSSPLLQKQEILFVLSECEPVVRTQSFVGFFALAEFLGSFGYRLSLFGVYEQQPEWDGRNSLSYWNALFICEKLVERVERYGKLWRGASHRGSLS